MMKLTFFALLAIATIAAAQGEISQNMFFFEMPERYAPFIDTTGLKVRGDCKTGFLVQSKFVIKIPNAEHCSELGFANPLMSGSTLHGAETTALDITPAKCTDTECTQTIGIKVTGVQCLPDPAEAMDVRKEEVSFSVDFTGKCRNINRNLGKVGVKTTLDMSDVALSRASKIPHAEAKRSLDTAHRFRARDVLGAACMSNATCNCNLYCNSSSLCDTLPQDQWRNTTCSAFDPPGSPACVTYYCNPAEADAYNSTVSVLGCAPIYQDELTPCTFVTEPGAAYGTATGICQGGYEGYCFSNNQAQFRISQSSTTTLPKTDDTDNFHADSKDFGHFIEGGLPLWAGTSVDKPVKRLVGLPLEDEQAITPPWVHKDEDDVIVGLHPDYPIDPGLVDDDEDNHDMVLNTIRTTTPGLVNCNYTLLLDENGWGIHYCSGQANTTAPNSVLLNGTYVTPRSHDFINSDGDDDDDDEDDGGDLHHVKLKKAGKYCSPVCYCLPVTFDGVAKFQQAYCTRGWWGVAGDTGDKDARWRAEVGIFVPMCWIILMVIGYWWLGTYSGLARRIAGMRAAASVGV